MGADTELIWHNDGHEIFLRLERSELVITGIKCPNDSSGKCHTTNDGCIVTWFVNRYGLECNVGICLPGPSLQIAWTVAGDPTLGFDSCQVWMIPTTDEFFAAWSSTQKTN